MPVFQSGPGNAPAWCEMEFFEVVQLPTGGTHDFERVGLREKLIVGKGECRIRYKGVTLDASEKTNLDLSSEDSHFEVLEVRTPTTIIRMCGRWGDEVGGSGLFSASNSDQPQDGGDPVDYPKQTNFDSHYHDCDEYWIIFEGSGVAVSEGRAYNVGTGDCVTTGMGHHHDIPSVDRPINAVYFETTLEGRKRLGHLWDHTHGKAEPQQDRI